MAKLNLSQAAKVTGKNRTTIWRHIKSGKLSAGRDRDGMPFIDTSELIRVYGELKQSATHKNNDEQHQATSRHDELIATINALRAEQAEIKEQIANLTNRLSYKPEPSEAKQEKGAKTEGHRDSDGTPENDPNWPKEINSINDIVLRDEIRKKLQKNTV